MGSKNKMIGEKLLRLRSRIEDWASLNGYENMGNWSERKNSDPVRCKAPVSLLIAQTSGVKCLSLLFEKMKEAELKIQKACSLKLRC